VGVPITWSSADRTEMPLPDLRDGAFAHMVGLCARPEARGRQRVVALDARFEHLAAAIETEVFLPAIDIDEAELEELCGPAPDDDGSSREDAGCGCASAPSSAGGFALIFTLLAVRRRPRRRR